MNTRERKKEKEKQNIEAFESNLKLHYESLKNELDTLIRATIPMQMNLIKTVLWFNIVLFGISLQLVDKVGVVNPIFTGTAFLSTCIAIAVALQAMIMGRKVHYGNYLKRTYMMSVSDGKWAKVDGLYRMMYDISRAIRYNSMVLIKRKRLIRLSMMASMASLIYFVILVYFNLMQGTILNGKQTAATATTESVRGKDSNCTKTGTAKAASKTTTKAEVNASKIADTNVSIKDKNVSKDK